MEWFEEENVHCDDVWRDDNVVSSADGLYQGSSCASVCQWHFIVRHTVQVPSILQSFM